MIIQVHKKTKQILASYDNIMFVNDNTIVTKKRLAFEHETGDENGEIEENITINNKISNIYKLHVEDNVIESYQKLKIQDNTWEEVKEFKLEISNELIKNLYNNSLYFINNQITTK